MMAVRYPRLLWFFAIAAPLAVGWPLWKHLPGWSASLVEVGSDGVYHVWPGESIQNALDAAARDSEHKIVRVHAGIYRPRQPGQAFVWMNRRHDGVTLEASGEVVLTAANPDVADPQAAGYPAIVNHVIYLGDGIGERTIVRGFKITGANHFVTKAETPGPIQPETGVPTLEKSLYYYADGGAIKIFGRSYPTIENLEIYGNYASPCAGGVSIDHFGFNRRHVRLRNCIFRDNRCQVTGSAIDVLPGSAALIENCLFVGNISNTGRDYVAPLERPYNGKHGSGALTVFRDSRVVVERCTFTGNWNGADDKGKENLYADCIFWKNTRRGGICPGNRYEMDILDARYVVGCFFHGTIEDLRGTINAAKNTMNAPDPEFDFRFRPRSAVYAKVGYRPVNQ